MKKRKLSIRELFRLAQGKDSQCCSVNHPERQKAEHDPKRRTLSCCEQAVNKQGRCC